MVEIEKRAHAAGFWLLTLDTVRGDAAEYLYAEAGWQRVGAIPTTRCTRRQAVRHRRLLQESVTA